MARRALTTSSGPTLARRASSSSSSTGRPRSDPDRTSARREKRAPMPRVQKRAPMPRVQKRAPMPRVRRTPRASDVAAVRRLVNAAGVFSRAECTVAVELIETRLAQGPRCGYSFAFAELEGQPVGYCTWGPIPMTESSWDLYWIAVDPSVQRRGLGRTLLAEAERAVARRRGTAVYVETSSRPSYAATRKFYLRAGYRRAARLVDFYAPGDDKIVLVKAVDPDAARVAPRAHGV